MNKGKPLNKTRKNKSKKLLLFERTWKVFSKYIRNRDKGKCFTCSTVNDPKYMNAGHFKHGKGTPIYFDEKNVHCQCPRCNMYYSGQRDIYLRNIQKKYGVEEGDRLLREGRKSHYYTIKELEEKKEYYEEKLKETKNPPPFIGT